MQKLNGIANFLVEKQNFNGMAKIYWINDVILHFILYNFLLFSEKYFLSIANSIVSLNSLYSVLEFIYYSRRNTGFSAELYMYIYIYVYMIYTNIIRGIHQTKSTLPQRAILLNFKLHANDDIYKL